MHLLTRAVATSDQTLDAAAVAAMTPAEVSRTLRLVPLRVLAGRRSTLVALMLRAPELHDGLRTTWTRQDPALTALIFRWVAQRRLHPAGTHGRQHPTTNWMRDHELVSA